MIIRAASVSGAAGRRMTYYVEFDPGEIIVAGSEFVASIDFFNSSTDLGVQSGDYVSGVYALYASPEDFTPAEFFKACYEYLYDPVTDATRFDRAVYWDGEVNPQNIVQPQFSFTRPGGNKSRVWDISMYVPGGTGVDLVNYNGQNKTSCFMGSWYLFNIVPPSP